MLNDEIQRSVIERFERGKDVYELHYCEPKFCKYRYWIERNGLTVARSENIADIHNEWYKMKNQEGESPQ